MADQLGDLVKKNGDRLARQIIAGAATTTPNLLEQPGDQTDRWKHNLVANPWQPHLDLDQDNVLVPHGDPWPATNANGTSPAIPQGHYGCRCETLIDNVVTSFAATRCEIKNDVGIINLTAGSTNPQPVYRFRSKIVANAAGAVNSEARDKQPPGKRRAWAEKAILAQIGKLN